MDKVSTFEFSASLEVLREAFASGTIPEDLRPAQQAILRVIISEMSEGPRALYVLSSDEAKEARDLFGYVLARTLMEHVRNTVLVDCDFLRTGLSGIVPQRDALGFLDMLLYGCSLGTITQGMRGGVKVIGAGSFPVTKRVPFAMEAFQEAVRCLLNQSRCAIFCGPAEDDEGNVHPIVSELSIAVAFRLVDEPLGDSLDPWEEEVSSQGRQHVLVIRMCTPREKVPERGAPAELEEILEAEAPEEVSGESVVAGGGRQGEGLGQAELGEAIEKRATSSLLPKVVTAVLGATLVAFLFYWLSITKSVREGGGVEGGKGEAPLVVAREETTGAKKPPFDTSSYASGAGEGVGEKAVPATSIEAGGALRQEVPGKVTQPDEKVDTSLASMPKEAPHSGVELVENLSPWKGKYVIHISSFRTIDNASKEAGYFKRKGFEVFLMRVDLGNKGKWYRVYAGPMESREEAGKVKLMLDEISRVKFTRIARIHR